MRSSQKGACTHSGDPSSYAVELTVNDDGSFTGEPIFTSGQKKGEQDASRPWMGHILSDLHVRLVAQSKATCKAEPRVYNTIYTGQFSEKKGKYRLTLKGTDNACPQFQCVFENTLNLDQK